MNRRLGDSTETMTAEESVRTRLGLVERRMARAAAQLTELSQEDSLQDTQHAVLLNQLRADRLDVVARLRPLVRICFVASILLFCLSVTASLLGVPQSKRLEAEVAEAEVEFTDAGLGPDAGTLVKNTPVAKCRSGAPCDPWFMQTLPYDDANNTRRSETRTIDRYACAPKKNQAGPEVWYRFTLSEPGRVVAVLEESKRSGVDVDLHLLTSTSADSCIRRHDRRIREALAPGSYYLVVDTRVAGDVERSGPYKLSVQVRP